MQESGRFVQTLMIVALWLVLFCFHNQSLNCCNNHSTVTLFDIARQRNIPALPRMPWCEQVQNWSIYSFWSSDEIHGWLGYR